MKATIVILGALGLFALEANAKGVEVLSVKHVEGLAPNVLEFKIQYESCQEYETATIAKQKWAAVVYFDKAQDVYEIYFGNIGELEKPESKCKETNLIATTKVYTNEIPLSHFKRPIKIPTYINISE